MTDRLEVNFARVKFRNPVIVGSALPTWDGEACKKSGLVGAGGIVPKTFGPPATFAKHPQCGRMRLMRQDKDRPFGNINLELYTTVPIEDWLNRELAIAAEGGAKIIASIVVGADVERTVELVKMVEATNLADMFELNVSCPMPDAQVGFRIGQDPELCYAQAKAVKAVAHIPVGVKMTPNISDMVPVAQAVKDAGADFVTISNSVRSLAGVNIETGKPHLPAYGGYTGPAIKPIIQRFVSEVARAVDIPISAVGGVRTWEDVVEFIMLGATTVQTVTAIMWDGYEGVTKLVNGLREFMERKGYNSIEDFRGIALPHIITIQEYAAYPPKHVVLATGYAPCVVACPAGVNAQGYVTKISEGKFEEALEVHRRVTPFAGVLGRICTHPCEVECERKKVEEPIAIRSLKRFMADYELKRDKPKVPPVEKTKEAKVAIIGSGPAGLSCAYDLVRQGYPVTVFEAAPKTGGLLRYGIPDYRLPKAILDNDISYIEELGVEVKTNSPVKDLADIFNQGYKAVFLATGAGVSQKMGIPGEDAKGVLHALDFLREVNSGKKVSLGNRVAVIGGGNAAVDAARVACRLEVKEVSIVYRRSRDEMLAIATEVDEAEREGVKLHILAAPVELLTENGQLKGIRCIRTELGKPDASGRRRPIPIKGSEFSMDVDNVIFAIGQAVDKSMLPKEIKYSGGETLSVNLVTLQTNVKGVFAGGDVIAGAADAISAIAAGKKAAISIDRYLNGVNLAEGRPASLQKVEEVSKEGVVTKARSVMPVLRPDERRAFAEVELGFSENEAVGEAGRCLHCGCSDCLTCHKVCFYEVHFFSVQGHTEQKPENCDGCALCVEFCPCDALALVEEEKK